MMLDIAIYGMVYLGSALMVYNIFGFVRFARFIRGKGSWGANSLILYIPIILLALFLAGYLAVAIFGNPDLIMAGILFGGSIFVFIMYVLLDRITKRIIESERLESELRAAEQSSRVKASFLSSVSHEMRTPLNVILGLDGMALRDPGISDQTREQLTKIDAHARSLLGLIDNVLEMNEAEAGGQSLKRERFSLVDILYQINAAIHNLCDAKGLRYESGTAGDIAGTYLGDAMQLRQALVSILDNAVKYTDAPGTVSLSVEGEPVTEGGIQTLRFTVADTGVGIDPEFLPRVFDAFSQENETSTNRYGGMGLGLSIAKSIVDGMGGTIEVSSKKGEGTVFTVAIPLDIAPEDAREGEAPDRSSGTGEGASLDGRLILIVEDLDENAEIVADILELEGVQSERAENGQVAIDMVSASPPGHYDAILMDLRMPVMDGLEAARRIRAMDREDARRVPIIALTANAFDSDVQQSLDAGMDMHLAKPADSDQLFEILGRLIAEREDACKGVGD